MPARVIFMSVGLLLLSSQAASALDLWKGLAGLSHSVPDCVGKTCCDDYRGKCPPPPRPVKRPECDDYRRKCAPCTVPVKQFACDDYRGKCLPPVCGPKSH